MSGRGQPDKAGHIAVGRRMIALEDLVVSDDPEKSVNDRLASIERELRRLPVSSGVVQVLADRPTARLIPRGDD